MSRYHNEPAMTHLVRHALALLLGCLALCAAPAARAIDSGDIVVASLKGEVHVTMRGAERALRAGAVLELPATVRTGRDGSIELRQGATSVSVGPDTLLEFPALQEAGGPIDRIVQPRGNAFYSIGKRPGRKLRVETPYLVGVVKGTQFSVAARDDGTTISLFEGLLEIRAGDDSSAVDIHAGEIATRSRGDTSIGVLKMDSGKAPPARAPQTSGNDIPGSALPADAPVVLPAMVDASNPLVSGDAARLDSPQPDDAVQDAGVTAGIDVRGAAEAGATVDSPALAIAGAPASIEVGASVGPVVTAAAIDVSVDAGAGAVDVAAAANVDLAAGNADVGLDTALAVGAASVDAGVNAGVDLGAGAAASVDVNAGVGAGLLTTDAGAGVAVDLGGGQGAASVDLGVNAAAGGVVAVDAGTSVDLGAGANVATDLAAHAGAVDVGANAGVDLGAGTVDLGVNLGGSDLNVGLDLGLDDDNDQGQDTGNTTPAPGNVVNDVVDTVDGLLKGLLRKPGKK
jgi:hypothetical protein